MKFSYIAFVVLVVLQFGLADIDSIFFLDPGDENCSKIVSYIATREVPYLETYQEKTWGIFYRTRTRWNYRLEYNKAYRKEFICCNGYNEVYQDGKTKCKPICQKPACGNGTCVRPEICICHRGYSKVYGDEKEKMLHNTACLPICSRTCVNGKCTAPETCTCNHGYSLSSDGYTCEPLCTVPCPKESYCSEPDQCTCYNGYEMMPLVVPNQRISHICSPICKKECIHGECTAPDTCTCKDGYEPDPNNLFACKPKCEHGCLYGTCTEPNVCTCDKGYSLKSPGVCEPICSEACIMGTCVAPESCSCFTGYGLTENSKYVCEAVCEKACLNGKCTTPGVCTCNEGFRLSGDESTKHICKPYCETSCKPFGVCTAPNICTCFEGYRLVDKKHVRKINTPYFADNSICEPICDTPCINGYCSAPETCSCDSGYYPSGNASHICEPVCPEKCVNGFCSAPQICTCDKGYRPSKSTPNVCEPFCETECINGYCSAPNECTCNVGYQPTKNNRTNLCEPICNPSCKNGDCIHPNVCSCKPGYRPSTHSTNVCDPICHPICEINGICEEPDRCVCKDGYRMVYYYVPYRCDPICDVECGNGTCVAPNVCTCFDGYRNSETGRCEPVCSECNNGTCVAPEICECDDGFVLEHPNAEFEVRASRSVPEDGPGNGTRCVPHCEGCDNGECVAPNECQCYAGFVRINDTCVHACRDGCGAHGKCVDERRTCECNYGWTGTQCEQPTLCVSIISDEENRTESLRIIEGQNATIEYVLINNPACPTCTNKINNETLCFKMYVNGTKDKTQIGCLMNRECLLSSSQYPKEIFKISAIVGSVGILFLIAIAIYVSLRKHRTQQISLGDITGRNSISTQGLIEENTVDS